MIFSRLFSPSHTSQKPEKRLQAIESLSPEKAQEKSILHELAFNDDDANVSIAALEKLNVFALWLKMSQIAKSPKVKKIAEKKVNDALLSRNGFVLSNSEKAAFLTETANAELIAQIVEQDTSLLNDDGLAQTLIGKVDKPSFTQFVFNNSESNALKQKLIADESDINALQKLAKKVDDIALKSAIESRIDALNLAAQKPLELKKQLTLSLSKYQALLEKGDVEEVVERQVNLENELSALFAESACLGDEEKLAFEEKYNRISEQVTRYLSRIKPAWEAKQKEAELTNTKALCEQQLTHASGQVDWLFNNKLCDATLADVATVNESVRGVEATIEQIERLGVDSKGDKRLGEIKHLIAALNDKLERFSLQQQYGQKLYIHLQSLEELADKYVQCTPEDMSDVREQFEQAKQTYFGLSSELVRLPKDFAARQKSAVKKVSAFERNINAKRNEELKQFRKQMTVVDNLIAQGKFRAAMSKFQKLQETYESLNEDAQRGVDRRYQKTKEDVSRLEGWQSYLAAPRKPALIEEAQKLADSDVDNIKARSEAIKYLRKQWISLSSVTSEAGEDTALQTAFDEALERAFEPCRAYYADLDTKRLEARKVREALIASVKALDNAMPEAELAKACDKLAKQWHGAGQVEREIYEALREEWKLALTPLQQKVTHWQNENQVQKRALVQSAKALAELDDTSGAADSAQALQAKWKLIGHAGKREESKLWAEFKAANDTVFEKLKADRKAQNNAFNQEVDTLLAKIDKLDENASDSELASLTGEVTERLQSLPKSLKGKVERQLAALENKRHAKQRDVRVQNMRSRAQALITLLQSQNSASSEENSELKEALGRRWVSALEAQQDNGAQTRDRQWLTVALEVSLDLPSPDADASIRSSVQLQMMTAKLEQGESTSAAEILSDWLALGEVDEAEKGLMQRVVSVLDTHPEVLA